MPIIKEVHNIIQAYNIYYLPILQVQFHEGMGTMAPEMVPYGCPSYSVLEMRPA